MKKSHLIAWCTLSLAFAAQTHADVKCSALTFPGNTQMVQATVPAVSNPATNTPNPHIYFLVKKDLSSATVTTEAELNQMQAKGFGLDTGDTVVVLQESMYEGVYAIILFSLDPSHKWDDPVYAVAEAMGPVGKVGLILVLRPLGFGVACNLP